MINADAGRIETIQVLRLVAALLVAAHHLPIDVDGAAGSWLPGGWAGVDLFFVLSGYIIASRTGLKPEAFSAASFLLDRALRIYPSYWIALGATLAVASAQALAGEQSRTQDLVTPLSLLASVTLFPAPILIMPIAWTLTLEIAFYGVFAVAYASGGFRAVMLALGGWYALALSYTAQFHVEGELISYLGHTVVLEFLFGVVVARLHALHRARWPRLALGAGSLAVMVVVAGGHEALGIDARREFVAGLPAAVLIYGAAGTRWRAPRALMLGGEASFALYLLHPLCFAVIGRIGEAGLDLRLEDSAALRLFAVAAALCVAAVFTLTVERSIARLRPRVKLRLISVSA